jgi:predicted MPP superfamily phosphohydrolase
MKNRQMLIFFLIVFTIYVAANTYIFIKGYRLFPGGRSSVIYTISFLVAASMFIAGKILERNHSGIISDILNVAGGFWLAYMLYSVLLYALSDIGFFTLRSTGLVHEGVLTDFRKWRFVGVNLLTAAVMVAGFINALSPVVKEYTVTTPGKIENEAGEVRIVAVSDIHLGSTIRRRSMKKLQGMIDSLKPEMVLLLGDIIDGEIGPVLRHDLLSTFRCPPCREGVYGITGNHEYIGGIDKTASYIRSRGIRLLEDEVVRTPSGITLIGRTDRDSYRFSQRSRKSLTDLMEMTDSGGPVIVMDHQPLSIDESVSNGIDLHLSGHTHNGQIWPLSLIITGMYEVPYGYRKMDNTHVIVSSGYGLWGPRVRVGSRPEVVLIRMVQSLEH